MTAPTPPGHRRQHPTRARRLPVAEWFYEIARRPQDFDVELVDLAEVELPLFDEPHHPDSASTSTSTPGGGRASSIAPTRSSSSSPSTTIR